MAKATAAEGTVIPHIRRTAQAAVTVSALAVDTVSAAVRRGAPVPAAPAAAARAVPAPRLSTPVAGKVTRQAPAQPAIAKAILPVRVTAPAPE